MITPQMWKALVIPRASTRKPIRLRVPGNSLAWPDGRPYHRPTSGQTDLREHHGKIAISGAEIQPGNQHTSRTSAATICRKASEQTQKQLGNHR